jgi:cardiolipin synthase
VSAPPRIFRDKRAPFVLARPVSHHLVALTVVFVGWFCVSATIILLQRRSAAATLAWLLVLAFLPIVGLVAYRLIGPLRLERKRLRRRAGRRALEEATGAMKRLRTIAAEDLQVAAVPVSLEQPPPLPASGARLLLDGASCYAALLEAIAAAKHHVHLEYYIWEPDRIGTRVRDALMAKAREGVKVRMLVDGTGSAGLPRRFIRELREAGVEFAWFNPVRFRFVRRRRIDFRTHRKIVVCDGRVGFTGGMNVADAHSSELGPDYWRDTHLRLEGAAVWALQRIFLEDWAFATERPFELTDDTFPPPTGERRHVAQIVASGPDHDHLAIHRTYFTVITRATRRLWITTPYFVPDEATTAALATAALRGVDVRLLIPARGDSRLIDLAARSYVPELLAAGVRVFEYHARFIHAKTFVVDDDLAIVGSANLDNRSFLLNFEVTALLYDRGLAAELAAAFEADLAASRALGASALARASLPRRLGESAARLLSPLL